MENPAIPLTGGRVAKGIVRIGDTVHRPSSSSAFTAKLDLQRSALVDAMLERQARNARYWAEAQSTFEATAEQFAERIAWSRREHDFTAAHREVFSG